MQTCVEITKHIFFNCYNSYDANECVDVKNGNNSLDYQPLMDSINQCEASHLWLHWVLKYLSTSCKGKIKDLMLSHLQDLLKEVPIAIHVTLFSNWLQKVPATSPFTLSIYVLNMMCYLMTYSHNLLDLPWIYNL